MIRITSPVTQRPQLPPPNSHHTSAPFPPVRSRQRARDHFFLSFAYSLYRNNVIIRRIIVIHLLLFFYLLSLPPKKTSTHITCSTTLPLTLRCALRAIEYNNMSYHTHTHTRVRHYKPISSSTFTPTLPRVHVVVVRRSKNRRRRWKRWCVYRGPPRTDCPAVYYRNPTTSC